MNDRASGCGCGHQSGLHDAYGCAVWLGAIDETRGVMRYCECKHTRDVLALTPWDEMRELPASPFEARTIVARIRVKERNGAAIGVCEQPQALVLGQSTAEVIAQIKVTISNALQRENALPEGAKVLISTRQDAGEVLSLEPLQAAGPLQPSA